jgi:Tfp pilus assembly protein PilZ
MGQWEGLNRRQFPRLAYPCLVKVRVNSETPEALLTHTENIGVGGICVIIRKEVKLFTSIDLEIDLMDEQDHILVRGRVVWVVRRKAIMLVKPLFYDIGVEFENLNVKDKKRLEAAIHLYIKKGYKVLKPVY